MVAATVVLHFEGHWLQTAIIPRPLFKMRSSGLVKLSLRTRGRHFIGVDVHRRYSSMRRVCVPGWLAGTHLFHVVGVGVLCVCLFSVRLFQAASIMQGTNGLPPPLNAIKIEAPAYYCNSYTPPGANDHSSMLQAGSYSQSSFFCLPFSFPFFFLHFFRLLPCSSSSSSSPSLPSLPSSS